VEAVDAAVAAALAQVRASGAPFFLEARLQRWPGSHQIKPEFTTGVTDVTHAWGPEKASGEYADWVRTVDPILRYIRVLISRNDATREDIIALDRKATGEMEAARAFAEASPFPQPDAAVAGVFA
jgi:pyruvate dehydrogenase E1 component alpha subunit